MKPLSCKKILHVGYHQLMRSRAYEKNNATAMQLQNSITDSYSVVSYNRNEHGAQNIRSCSVCEKQMTKLKLLMICSRITRARTYCRGKGLHFINVNLSCGWSRRFVVTNQSAKLPMHHKVFAMNSTALRVVASFLETTYTRAVGHCRNIKVR